jgi:hypothetical protein
MRHKTLSVAIVAVTAVLISSSSRGGDQNDGTVAKAAPPIPAVTVLGSRQAEGVLGKEVRSRTDERLGRIVDVIVDRSGRVRAAIIDFGGFFGIGNRKIAVEWDALNFAADADNDRRDTVTLELTREQIRSAPEYKDRRAVIVIGAAGSLPITP